MPRWGLSRDWYDTPLWSHKLKVIVCSQRDHNTIWCLTPNGSVSLLEWKKTIECWAFVPFGKCIMEFERVILVLYRDRDWMVENVITIPVYATMANHLCRLTPLKEARQQLLLNCGSIKALPCCNSRISVLHSYTDKIEIWIEMFACWIKTCSLHKKLLLKWYMANKRSTVLVGKHKNNRVIKFATI